MTEAVTQTQSAYSAVRAGGAGLIDLSSRGRILVSGSDTVMFLNGLVTNDVKSLSINSWIPAAFANVQGRLMASVRIIHRADGFLIDTEPETREKVFKLLERFTLAGDFQVQDLTNETATLSLQGKGAVNLLRSEFGFDPAFERGATFPVPNGLDIVPATHTAESGFDLFMAAGDAREWRDKFAGRGAVAVDDATQEILRIEAGIPRYGIDMDENTVLNETNLEEAISFTKGCYTGQEIIIRIKHRGHVAKKLTGLLMDHETPLAPSATIWSETGDEIGRVTSVCVSPRLTRTIALAYVKYDYLAVGTKVKVKDATGTVILLPFIRGGWYENVGA
jgi:folate-binding protein YgfZ